MPIAICKVCGKRIHYHNWRGTKIADMKCECGGELRGEHVGRKNPHLGEKFQICVLCNRKRLGTQKIDYDFTQYPGSEKIYPAGSNVCTWHNPVTKVETRS